MPTEDETLEVVSFVEQQRCTYACLTISVAATIPLEKIPDCFQCVNQAGEPLNSAMIKKFREAGIQVTSSYGPAEASVFLY